MTTNKPKRQRRTVRVGYDIDDATFKAIEAARAAEAAYETKPKPQK